MHLFLFLLVVVNHSFGILLNNADEVERYINKLIVEFEGKPQDFKFSSVIHPPFPSGVSSKCEFFLPKVLLWSPQEHFGVQMKCPVHGNNLRPLKWTNTVSGKKDHDARLVFDIQGNIILVQRVYNCVRGRITHSLRSTSLDVINSLPCSLQAYFPLELFQRSGCTKNLLQYIETQVLQGVNFMKISEGLASLNFQAFCRQQQIYSAALMENNVSVNDASYSEFYSNPLYAFPSNDQIINLFLNVFKTKKHLYEIDMQKVTAAGLSCDHTFKISRNIGLVREEDNKFDTQFSQLYVALNENGEVLAWKLTKSTAFSEIQDLLVDLKERLELSDSQLEVICVDDCCHVRNQYNTIFKDVEVKLDLFHACQRVVRTVSPTNPLYRDMLRSFSQIFREDDDQGEVRLKDTPEKDKIERNLNSFLERWSNVPSSPLTRTTLAEIEKLRGHIAKGCLSNIPAGYGTERNEYLHRLLNRSLITGATRISTELAVALLTILLHYHSKKASACSHSCNKKIKPVIPVDTSNGNKEASTTSTPQHDVTSTVQEEERNKPLDPSCSRTDEQVFVVLADNVNDVCNEKIASVILKSAYNLKETIENTAKQSFNRSFNALDMLYVSKMSDVLCIEDNNEEQDPTINSHMMNLDRQLAGFGLRIDPVQRDGDCAFRSVIKEITKRSARNNEIREHMESLNLSNLDEDQATFALRQLFVKELTEENGAYQNFVTGTKEELALKAIEFQERGVFDREIGDVVMKACSNILRIPIMLITSNQAVPYVPFFPDDPLSNDPIYVAYHYYGAGHYDATTTETTGPNLSEGKTLIAETQPTMCYCGRKAKSRSEHFCASNGQNKSRCPCVSNQRSCTSKCRCLNCMNRMDTRGLKADQKCRCGESNRNKAEKSKKQACADIPGERRTKCPCYVQKQPCTAKCSCHNCGNDFGKRESQANVTAEKRRVKCTSSPSSLKRKRTTTYHKENDLDIKQGSWTLQETCIIDSVESFLFSSSIIPSAHNVEVLYNYVVSSLSASNINSLARSKTINQVMGKLEYCQKRHEALKKMLYGITLVGALF